MSDGFQFYDIIFFALIAIFIILRLRGVLGRRTGQHRQRHADRFARTEQPPEEGQGQGPSQGQGEVVQLPDRTRPAREAPQDVMPDDVTPEPVASRPMRAAKHEAAPEQDDAVGGLRAGLEQIKRADHEFSPHRFAAGAQAAFEMVVESFAKGDTATLRPLLGDDVYDEFAAAIRERMAEGHIQETTIVALDAAEIISAEMRSSTARVTVKFVSQQINVVRDKDGEEVGGDSSLIERVTDIWTFARNTRSSDPNWALIETSIPN
ncbi:MAG: Tim44/TimA family putative adaptor protein [Rhodospirillaceae bacterium]|nr:Tim44/TimA family putative adaptor protein [Rhodospirillaceae bacterium]